MNKDGGGSYRGAVYYQTSSTKWPRLNSVAAIYEYEVDAGLEEAKRVTGDVLRLIHIPFSDTKF